MCKPFSNFDKLTCVHVLIFLLLIALAVWDITYLIDNFMNDNRASTVKIESINQTYPFLENDTFTLCIMYQPAMYPEMWQEYGPDFDPGPVYLEKIFSNGIDQVLSRKIDNFSLDDLMTLGVLVGEISKMDESVFECAKEKTSFPCREDTNMSVLPQLDSALKPDLGIASIQEAIWNRKIRDLLFPFNSDWKYTKEFDLLYFTHQNACVEIDLSILTKRNPMMNFGTGYVNEDDFFNTSIIPPIAYLAIISDNFEAEIQMSTMKSDSSKVQIEIKNNGIFDKSITSGDTCRTKRLIDFAHLREDDLGTECGATYYLTGMADVCQCIPYSYRKQWRKISTKNLPFCTFSMYQQCKMEKYFDFRDRDCPPACIQAKNQYSWVSSKVQFPDDDGQGYASTYIFIHCVDKFYAIYQERYLQTISQLLAQIGGDIGLYTGLSVLTLWQVIVFIQSQHKNLTCSGKIVIQDGVKKRGVGEFLRNSSNAFQEFMGSRLLNKAMANEEFEVEKRLEKMENQIVLIQKQIREDMDEIKKEMAIIVKCLQEWSSIPRYVNRKKQGRKMFAIPGAICELNE